MSAFAAVLRTGHGDSRDPLGPIAARLGISTKARLTDGPAGLLQADSFNPDRGTTRLRAEGPALAGLIRLTNGHDLAQDMGRPYRGDAETVLALFDRYGHDMLLRLDGDFGFALYDPNARSLLVVRDKFGVIPVAFRVTPNALLVASDAAALDDCDTPPDCAWIAQFLDAQDHPPGSTPFPEVHTVLPGHFVLCRAGETRQAPWWHLTPVEIPAREAPEALFAALSEAVQRRMDDKTATLLSGGLDSSSVTCIAARTSAQPVPAISIRYPSAPALDEGPYIDAVRAKGNILGLDVPFDPSTAPNTLDRALSEMGYPIFAPNQAKLNTAYGAVAPHGARTVLDGHGGDEVIGTGHWIFSEFAAKRQWRKFLREARAHHAAGDSRDELWEYLLGALSIYGPRGLRRVARHFLRNDYERSLPSLARSGLEDTAAQPDPVGEAAYAFEHLDDPFQRVHARMLHNPFATDAFVFLHIAARHRGIEVRFPFYDHHVVAIALGQKTRDKIAPRQQRLLLRRAMDGVLPDKVRTRCDKMDFAPGLIDAMQRDWLDDLKGYVSHMPGHLEPYVAPDALSRCLDMFHQPKTQRLAFGPLLRVVWLESWLRQRKAARPITGKIAV